MMEFLFGFISEVGFSISVLPREEVRDREDPSSSGFKSLDRNEGFLGFFE
jgi:hypothetical protein